MKKNISKMICYIIVTGSLTACTLQNNSENSVVENQESILLEESVKEKEVNTSLEGMTLLEMKKYIENHKKMATKSQMDKMVIAYDKELRHEYKELFEKFISNSYFKAINNTKDKHCVLHIKNIKNNKMRQEVLQAVKMGYCFSMEEGAYYLVIDYKELVNNYEAFLSDELKSYYLIKKDEQLAPVRVDGYLNISSKDLYKRAVAVEEILKTTPNFPFRDDIKGLLSTYVDALLSIDIFSATIDYETGQVSQSTLVVFDKIIKENNSVLFSPVLETNKFLETKDYILKFDDQEGNQEILNLRNKYTKEIQGLIDQTYPIN